MKKQRYAEDIHSSWEKPRRGEEILPVVTNRRLRQQIADGQRVLKIAVDPAVRHGQGADALERLDIMEGGVSLTTLQDMQTLFCGIQPTDISLQIQAGAENAALLGMTAAWLRANGYAGESLQGIIGADPLGVLAVEGTLPLLPAAIYDLLAREFIWAEKHLPRVGLLAVDSRIYQAAGASPAQEIACALAVAQEYLREMQRRGIAAARIFSCLSFACSFQGASSENLAARQVLRRLWSEMSMMHGAGNPPLRFFAEATDIVRRNAGSCSHLRWVRLPGSGFDPGRGRRQRDALFRETRQLGQDMEQLGGMLRILERGMLTRFLGRGARRRFQNACAAKHLPLGILEARRLKSRRLADIGEYVIDMDEAEKRRALAALSIAMVKEPEGVPSRIEQAFLSGASISDIVIQLHAEQPDFYAGHGLNGVY